MSAQAANYHFEEMGSEEPEEQVAVRSRRLKMVAQGKSGLPGPASILISKEKEQYTHYERGPRDWKNYWKY